MINEKKKKFCKADKHDEYTDPPVVLKSNALTFLEGTDIQESLKIVFGINDFENYFQVNKRI